jgi:branched-chain amino acid transport system substrate-binding protein
MKYFGILFGTVAAAALLPMQAAVAQSDGPIRIGLLVTQEGTFTSAGNDAIRGFELALKQADSTAGGRKIEWVLGPTDATPDTLVRAARKLVDSDKVELVVGPLSGSEGIAMRDFARTNPNVTFINGVSSAMEATFVDPAENFFRFNLQGAQAGYGLGSYIFKEREWNTVAAVSADYSFGYTNFLGFAADFCQAGGDIVERFWVPLGNSDFGSVIAALPDDVDAIYLGLGGTDAINFLNQYEQAGADINLVGSSILADQSVLTARGRAAEALVGTPAAGWQASDSDLPKWQEFVAAYQAAWPENQRYPEPSLYATLYYNAAVATLQALDTVNGDLGNGQAAFREALSKVELDSPIGLIKLDENRQAIGSVFITEVVKGEDGNLTTKLVSRQDNVDATFGMSKEDFMSKVGLPSRDTPDCAKLRG